MINIAEIAKMDAPPEMYHAANDSIALIELEVIDEHFKFYHELIPKNEMVVLNHDKLKETFALFVPIKYKDICIRKEQQLHNLLDTLKEVYKYEMPPL